MGAMIRVLRHQAGMSQADLAGIVGLSRASIANIETGRQNLTESTLNRIGKALGYRVHVTFRKIT